MTQKDKWSEILEAETFTRTYPCGTDVKVCKIGNDILNQFTSRIIWSKNKLPYVRVRFGRDGVFGDQFLHRIVINAPKHVCVDHINNDSLDNRLCNLRTATPQQNSMNRKIDLSRSLPKGVCKKKSKFVATICHNGKKLSLGFFTTSIAAAVAYDKAAIKLDPEFYRRNFPDELVAMIPDETINSARCRQSYRWKGVRSYEQYIGQIQKP